MGLFNRKKFAADVSSKAEETWKAVRRKSKVSFNLFDGRTADALLLKFLTGDKEDGCCGLAATAAYELKLSEIDWIAFAEWVERVLAALGPFLEMLLPLIISLL